VPCAPLKEDAGSRQFSRPLAGLSDALRLYPRNVFDVMTLRFVVGLVSLTVLALFYLAVFRPTRSAFSGWWSLALLCASASSAFLLADGTPFQVVSNPASTAASAAGAMCVYFAARSLRPKGNSVWLLIVATLVCVVGAAFDEPATNDWAGNGLLFAVMAAAFTAGAVEVWGTWSIRRNSPDARDSGEAITALVVSALAATLLATMYILRLTLYVTLGHEHPTFTQIVGSPTAALTLLICLVAVTFSVSGIGWDQRTRELRYQVARDDLTGLLGRAAFVARADEAIAASGGRRESQTWLVIADVDNFKPVNDEFGHQAGDRTLQAFADAARGAMRTADTV